MSATNTFEDKILALLFTNTDLTNVGDAAGLQASASDGQFYFSLHTAALADTDSLQTTSEATYTSYARVGVARNSSQWTVLSGNVDNDNAITFPEATGGSNTITDFGLGFNASGGGELQIYGALTASLAVSNGITPQFNSGDLDISVD